MFTGIVEELGRVRTVTANEGGARIEIAAATVLGDVELGASIAVNGCCLTVVAFDPGREWWAADAVVETLRRTTLGRLAPGDPVNLERPMRADARFGGHIVQGHVDGTGEVVGVEANSDGSVAMTIACGTELARLVVEKGSITVDGVSLTVVEARDDAFSIALIPHTLAVTTLGSRRVGDRVNLEADIIAKHVDRLVAPHLAARMGTETVQQPPSNEGASHAVR